MNKSILLYILFFAFLYFCLDLVYFHTSINSVTMTFATIGVFIIGLTITMLHYRKSLGGYVSFSKLMAFGLIVSIVGSTLGDIGQLAFFKSLSADKQETIKRDFIDKSYSNLLGVGEADMEEEMGMEDALNTMFEWKRISFGLVGSVLFGVIFTVIIALILKKEKPLFPS